jgi:hypothetical protein
MGRRRALVFAVLLSLGGLLAVVMPTAAHAEQQVPITLQANPRCDIAAGSWDVWYVIRNYAPVDLVIDSAVDPVSGESFTPTSPTVGADGIVYVHRTLPGSTTQLKLRVRLHRVDRTSTIELDDSTSLPSGCVTQPSNTPCVNTDAVRYHHTFDAVTGTATIQIVGPPLCAGQYEILHLESRTDEQTLFRDPYDQDVFNLDAGYSAVVLHVKLPPCHAHVFMFFDVQYGHPVDDPSLILGASAFPGNRSSGPLADAWLAGPACTSAPSAYIASNCDGTMSFHVSNAASANVSTEVKFQEVTPAYVWLYREVVLEPGESAVVTVAPPNLGPTEQVWWHNNVIAEATYRPSFTCTASRQPIPRSSHPNPGPSTSPLPRMSHAPAPLQLPRLVPSPTG